MPRMLRSETLDSNVVSSADSLAMRIGIRQLLVDQALEMATLLLLNLERTIL